MGTGVIVLGMCLLGAYLKRDDPTRHITYRKILPMLVYLKHMNKEKKNAESLDFAANCWFCRFLGTVPIRIRSDRTRPYRIPLMWISTYRSFLSYESL
ncbi:hypothetical protein BDV11DRAFT_32743 [Aspergillus similis]